MTKKEKEIERYWNSERNIQVKKCFGKDRDEDKHIQRKQDECKL